MITTDGDLRMHGSKRMLQKRNAVLVVIALVISSLNSIALPSAFAITPVAPGNLVMCKSLKTNYQYVSTTGACNNKIYETIKWYKKGSAPTGTPGSKLISLNTCQSKSTIGAIVLKAKCNIKTETTLLWQRPLGPPGAPIIKSVLPGKLGSAEIEYLAPENNGGARVLSYKALSNPGAFMATVQKESSGKITVTGLQPGTKYTFTVLATNSVGTSLASLSSLEMFAPTTANAPIIKSVEISGPDDAKIAFIPSDFDGGTPITEYEVVTHPYAAITHSVTSPGTIELTGLAPGTEYTFTLIACNSAGDSEESNTSNVVRTPVPVPAPDPVPVQSGGGTPSLTSQTLTIDSSSFTSTYAINAAAPTLTSTSSGGTGVKSYLSSTLAVCTINSSTGAVVFVSPGTCTVTASIAADSTYSSATSSSVSFTITLATQVLTWAAGTSLTMAQSPHTPSTLASGSGSPAITYAVTSAGTTGCTVNASTAVITYTGAGSCTITATAAATSVYASATKSVVFSIALISRTISIDSSSFTSSYTFDASAPTLTSTASANDGVKWYYADSVNCNVQLTTGLVTFIKPGTCTFSARVWQSNSYADVTSSAISITVTQATQMVTITSTAPGSANPGGPTYSLTATGGASGNSVTFGSLNASVCTVSGAIVSFVGLGTCTITGDQAGNINYSASTQVTQNITVTASTSTSITSFGFLNGALVAGTVDNTAHTVAVTLPYGETTTRYPTFVLANGATAKVSGVAQVSGSTTNNYSSPVTYVITAQDNTTTQNYVVTLTIALNADATFTSFAFNGLTPALVEGPGGKVAISNTWNSITVIFLPGTDRTSLVPTFTLATGATVKVGSTSQTSGVTANNYSSNLTYVVTAQDGTTTKAYTLKVGSAALSTGSKIKGQTPLIVGTPSTDSSTATGGSISILSVQAANISNAGSYVTLFSAFDASDEVMRAVKYAAGANYTGFETDSVYANAAITDGDFFIVKVKSVDTITILYYKIVVTVVVYNIGDIGPGGGIVFYKDLTTGFNCGAAFSNTGSPTGGLCHYLEAAPNTWYGGSTDPQLVWANSENVSVGIDATDSFATAATPININIGNSLVGLGWYYSETIVAAHRAASKEATAALAAINYTRTYLGNTYSDWYLPNSAELNLLCQWKGAQTPTPGVACSGSGVGVGGFEFSAYLSSSISVLDPTGTPAIGVSIQSFTWTPSWLFRIRAITGVYVRPVRSF